MLESSDNSVQSIFIEPVVLVDELSSTEFYIGTSRSFGDVQTSNWKIKKIYKSGSVWKTGYPDGDQGFTYIWNDRLTYSYS
jgi:hypothetical protein